MNIIEFKPVVVLFILTFFASCQENLSIPDCEVSFQIDSQISLEKLSIKAPDDFGGSIIDISFFKDSLAYVLPSKPKNKIFVIDMEQSMFIEEIDLDPNFIEYPSGIEVYSKDSIFISEHNIPVIFLLSSTGEILNSYNLYRENLWEMPMEGFSNFSLYFGFGRTFTFVEERNSFYFPLKQLDLWYFVDQKSEFPTFGEYSLNKKEFVGLYGKYPGVYSSDKNTNLPFYLSHPVMERVKDRIILSFPLDPYLYIYDLEGKFLQKKCGSISTFKLSEPLEYSMDDYDTEGIMNYNKQSSYFGNFFYVEEKKKFVRIFIECVKGSGQDCLSKNIYALLIDENLEIEMVKKLPDSYGSNFFTHQVQFKSGFLSKVADLESDDEFILSDYFIIN